MKRIYTFIENSLILQVIKNSFISIMPFSIVSSLFVLILNFPIPTFTEFMKSNFEILWTDILPSVPNAFNNLISIYLLVSISFNYSKLKDEDTILHMLNSVFTYFIFLPTSSPDQLLQSFGSSGIFYSMICSIMSVYCLSLCSKKRKIIKFHSSVPEEVNKSFEYLLPILLSTLVIFSIKSLMVIIGIDDPALLINNIIQTPITKLGSSLPAIVVINFASTFLWFFGFNGSYIVNSIMNPIYFSLNMENLESISLGQSPIHIITGTFQTLFVNFGGSGSTIALIICLIIFSKDNQKITLGKLSLIPGIFNINEPIVYGLPVILNFKIIVPFLLCPVINTIISYSLMSIGIVEKTNGIQVPWTTPPIISGFLASGISGALLQAFLIMLNVLMYFPFLRKESTKVN